MNNFFDMFNGSATGTGVGPSGSGTSGTSGRTGTSGTSGVGSNGTSGTSGLSITGYWRSVSEIPDDGTVTLPAITSGSSMSGEVVVSSAGVLDANYKFVVDYTGNVTLQYGTNNVVSHLVAKIH
jgi:hypothetical protein